MNEMKFDEEIKKLPCYFWYTLSALSFEGTISVLFLLIGMIFFDYNWYYYLTAAFLGGMWSHRMHQIYPTLRMIYLKDSKVEAKIYLREEIFGAEGHKLRCYLSISFFIADVILGLIYLRLQYEGTKLIMEINITTIALIVTSVATVAYATLTYFLLREMRREKKKPIIEEILGVILYPLKYFLDGEITDFKKGNARLSFIKGKFRMESLVPFPSWGVEPLVYGNFRKSHPDLAKLIDKHDDLVAELETKADAIAKVLYTPKFKKKCRELIEEWDEEVEKHLKLSRAYDGDRLSENLLTYIVDNIEDLIEGHVLREFWEKKHDIFFKDKERLAKKQCNDLKNTLKRLSDFTENLLTKTNKLIEKYQKKYGISAKYVTDKYKIFNSAFNY